VQEFPESFLYRLPLRQIGYFSQSMTKLASCNAMEKNTWKRIEKATIHTPFRVNTNRNIDLIVMDDKNVTKIHHNPRNIKNVKISSKNIFANGNLLRKRIHSKL
jgi:hypothetical protein